mgnify:CR=1 FL=1
MKNGLRDTGSGRMMEDKDIKILHEQLKLITKNYKWGIKYLGDGDQAGGDIIWYTIGGIAVIGKSSRHSGWYLI